MRRTVTLAVSISLLLTGSAAAEPTLIAPLHGATAIKSFGHVVVWSDYEVADRRWHLVVDADGTISTPAIPGASETIQADVGPGPSGAPLLVHRLCQHSCHLVVSNLDGSQARPVPDSYGARDPTIWGDRVAWVRGANRPITSRLDGSARVTLHGAPREICEPRRKHPRVRCTTTMGREVTGLELYSGRLALTASFSTRDGDPNGEGEVLTEAVTGGPQHLIAVEGVEEGGGTTFWLGPSWSEGTLYFYEDGLPECVEHCIYVYGFDPAHNRYLRASASAALSGFSMAEGRRAYEATAPGNGYATPEDCAKALTPEEELTPCVIRLSSPIAFKPAPPPISIP